MRCKCGKCFGATQEQTLDNELLWRLDVLRAAYGDKIFINSGWRCRAHNVAVGGADGSYHMEGRAADITADRIGDLMQAAERLNILPRFKFLELIKYPQKKFIHVAV